ncbi:MAG: RrF2 family transcriptional regulator [Planctomycetota bacterium]|jgi:Rrf2 family protein
MALTQTAEYALRAVAWLAQKHGEAQTAPQIATATQVPTSYLPKVLQPLVRAGLLSGQRGLGGGYALIPDPKDLAMLDVIDAVDPIQRIRQCPLSLESHGARLCPLHGVLDQLLEQEEKRLAAVTLQDLIKPHSSHPRPLCEVAEKLRTEASSEGQTAPSEATVRKTKPRAR